LRRASTWCLLSLASLLGPSGYAQPLASQAGSGERQPPPGVRFVKDPINEEIKTFRHNVRQLYNNSRFDELEKIAQDVRTAKAKFGNGSWKIVRFYDSLECRMSEPESMWLLHDRIHRDWIAKKPESITAKLAYADFLCSFAWHARGYGYASSVTREGWKLFRERLAAAHVIVDDVRKMDEKDPYRGVVALTVALGEGAEKRKFEAILGEAHAGEPLFWGYFTKRAVSLLPRWYGEPGEWEAFAMKASDRPDGLGAEIYARIVLALDEYHDNVFKETEASWPKTREGLELMLKRYPDSLEFVNEAARLATLAQDRETAKAMFDRLDGSCVPSVWNGEKEYLAAVKWLQAPARAPVGPLAVPSDSTEK
jgi:hypothetical protein